MHCAAIFLWLILAYVESSPLRFFDTARNSSQVEMLSKRWCEILSETAIDLMRCVSMQRRMIYEADVLYAGSKQLQLKISNFTMFQASMLNKTNDVELSFLVCEPYGGIGNVLAALASCFLVALASGRALLVSWDGVGPHRPWSPPYEAPLGDFLLPPTGLDWSFDSALRKFPELREADPRRDVHLSGLPPSSVGTSAL